MIVQIKDYPYYWTDGIEIYSNNGKFKKLTGWKQTYNYRWRYNIKKTERKTNFYSYFFKDELPTIYNKGLLYQSTLRAQ